MKKLLVLLLLLPKLAFGAVAYDNADSAQGGTISTLTIVNFAMSGSNPLMYCGSGDQVDEADPGPSVTFNSVSMSEDDELIRNSDGLNRHLFTWKLTGNSGTHDVVLTVSAVGGGVVIGCMSFNGVDQGSPVGTSQKTTDYLGAPISVTVPTDGLAADFAFGFNASGGCGTYTAGGSQSKKIDTCNAGISQQLGGSTRTTSGTFTWTGLGDDEYPYQIGNSINPATASSTFGVMRRRQ